MKERTLNLPSVVQTMFMSDVGVSRFVASSLFSACLVTISPKENMAAIQAELAGLDSQGSAGAHVKVERAPSPIAVPQHGEVIDLTLDD